MAADPDIVAYYDELAPNYDADRFGNSYGRWIDAQERAILRRFLPDESTSLLDIACGTGRLSDRAQVGVDASQASLEVAARKHPRVEFVAGDATALPFDDARFSAAQAFHLLMHLDAAAIDRVFAEAARVLKPGGIFIVDAPSALRRAILRHRRTGWHGASGLDRAGWRETGARHGLKLVGVAGVALLPVHRLPRKLRSALTPLDMALTRLAPDLSSYMVAKFIKTGARS